MRNTSVFGQHSGMRLLTRHFLRRFMENDLIAPGSDRHETVALGLAVLISISVFLSFFLTEKYLAEFIQLPGRTVHLALTDRLLLITFSMTVTALVTLLTWDALGLESRDSAILGPLPLQPHAVALAKIVAILLFAAGFSLFFNLPSSLLYPVLMTEHFHLPAQHLLRVVCAHAAALMLASLFTFLTVLAFRGILQAIVSVRWFERVSSVVQTVFVVVALSAMFLLPVATRDVSNGWLRRVPPVSLQLLPPFWFLGLEASLEAHTVADTPIIVPRGFRLWPTQRQRSEAEAVDYRNFDPVFRQLAGAAVNALAIVTATALLVYAWNSRRLPLPKMSLSHRSRIRTALSRWALHFQQPTARAGFSFTLQVLARSAPHRVAMSAAVAVGVSGALVLAHALPGWTRDGTADLLPPSGVFGAQLAIVGALLVGLRHAVRLPAALAANWVLQMAWQGEQRQFLAGVRRAAIVVAILAPLAILLPGYIALASWPVGVAHAVCSGLAALTLLDLLMLGVSGVPFASPYVPLDNPKLWWPVSLAALFVVPLMFGWIERAAFASLPATFSLIGVLTAGGAIAAYTRNCSARRATLVFDELPGAPTQRLGLRERIMS
jgi:hypothetical protein